MSAPSSLVGTPSTSISALTVHGGPSPRMGWNQDMNQYESNVGAVKVKGRHGGLASRVINRWMAAVPSSVSPTRPGNDHTLLQQRNR